jgi:tryptophan 2,3-dioxygenase
MDDRTGVGTTTAAAGRQSGASVDPVYNERGIIAEHYRDLQGLPRLDAAREKYPLPRASSASTTRAVFQAVELALLNLADIVFRAAADVESRRLGPASVKMCWARGFHRVLLRLSMMPSQLGTPACGEAKGQLNIADSPALQEFGRALRQFDRAMLARIDAGELDLDGALGDRSLDSVEFMLLHTSRVSSHEATVWEQNLTHVPVASPVPSYETFVVAEGMRDAVYDRTLTGDTYFTQFRGLHQIPETLGEEANDHLEQAIRDVRSGNPAAAIAHLRCTTVLCEGMLASLPPMADNLATSDYHQIRENLGLTSGSHSVCLRFHMFTDLYQQLWQAVSRAMTGAAAGASDRDDVAANIGEAIREIEARRYEDAQSWLFHQLLDECLTFRGFVLQWREMHLHMPRNNLGGGYTKSLTGSPDAVLAVTKMRRAARLSDAMLPLALARGLAAGAADDRMGSLASYIDSEASLDRRILDRTGQVTQQRFVDVQERLGFFANRCPFSPPPTRRA